MDNIDILGYVGDVLQAASSGMETILVAALILLIIAPGMLAYLFVGIVYKCWMFQLRYAMFSSNVVLCAVLVLNMVLLKTAHLFVEVLTVSIFCNIAVFFFLNTLCIILWAAYALRYRQSAFIRIALLRLALRLPVWLRAEVAALLLSLLLSLGWLVGQEAFEWLSSIDAEKGSAIRFCLFVYKQCWTVLSSLASNTLSSTHVGHVVIYGALVTVNLRHIVVCLWANVHVIQKQTVEETTFSYGRFVRKVLSSSGPAYLMCLLELFLGLSVLLWKVMQAPEELFAWTAYLLLFCTVAITFSGTWQWSDAEESRYTAPCWEAYDAVLYLRILATVFILTCLSVMDICLWVGFSPRLRYIFIYVNCVLLIIIVVCIGVWLWRRLERERKRK